MKTITTITGIEIINFYKDALNTGKISTRLEMFTDSGESHALIFNYEDSSLKQTMISMNIPVVEKINVDSGFYDEELYGTDDIDSENDLIAKIVSEALNDFYNDFYDWTPSYEIDDSTFNVNNGDEYLEIFYRRRFYTIDPTSLYIVERNNKLIFASPTEHNLNSLLYILYSNYGFSDLEEFSTNTYDNFYANLDEVFQKFTLIQDVFAELCLRGQDAEYADLDDILNTIREEDKEKLRETLNLTKEETKELFEEFLEEIATEDMVIKSEIVKDGYYDFLSNLYYRDEICTTINDLEAQWD